MMVDSLQVTFTNLPLPTINRHKYKKNVLAATAAKQREATNQELVIIGSSIYNKSIKKREKRITMMMMLMSRKIFMAENVNPLYCSLL